MKQEKAIPLFFLTRSLFFGLGISLICKYTSKDTYIGAIIGTVLGLLIVWGYRYVIRHKDEDITQTLRNNKTIGSITRLLLLAATSILLLYTLITYKTFVSSFLLPSTPVLMSLIPWLLLIIYCALGGLKLIYKVSYALFPIALVFALLAIISTFGNFEIYNFQPVLTTSPTNLLASIISFAGISAFPGILSLHFKKDTKNILTYYILGALSIVICLLCINGVFGEVLVNVFRFPEYMILKQVKLLDFIEKIENVLAIVWLFDLFITSAFCVYSLKTLVPKKHNTIYTLVIISIISMLVCLVFDFNYVLELHLYYAIPYISLLFPLVILILFFILLKSKHQ